MPQILLTDETWARLKGRAEPFEDTPDDVVRRLLDATDNQDLPDGKDGYATGKVQSLDTPLPSVVTAGHHSNTPSITGAPAPQKRRHSRLGHGLKVPQGDFRNPILMVLQEMEGRGHAREVLKAVERRMSNRLSHVDYQILPSGQQKRWEKSANWERQQMVNDGLLRNDSQRGVWELTEAGWAEARKIKGAGE